MASEDGAARICGAQCLRGLASSGAIRACFWHGGQVERALQLATTEHGSHDQSRRSLTRPQYVLASGSDPSGEGFAGSSGGGEPSAAVQVARALVGEVMGRAERQIAGRDSEEDDAGVL